MAKQKSGGGRSAAARRTVIKSREKARSNAYTRKTIEASKNKPLTQTGSQGSGGGKKPPTTTVATASKEPSRNTARGTGGRTGLAKKRTGVANRKAPRTEKYVGSGTAPGKKALPKGTSSKAVSTAAKVGKAAAKLVKGVGYASAVGAAAAEIGRTIDQKRDPARPTVREHAAAAKAKRASQGKISNPRTGRTSSSSKAGGTSSPQVKLKGRVTKGAPPGTMQAAANSQKKASSSAPKPTPKSSSKGGGRKSPGYTYTGPKVGSAEYKAMRRKKYEANKAKARRNIAASRSKNTGKSATIARQQGTTAPNYQHPVMQRRNGNEHNQNIWTGDRASTNRNIARNAVDNVKGGGEEKGYWHGVNERVKAGAAPSRRNADGSTSRMDTSNREGESYWKGVGRRFMDMAKY